MITLAPEDGETTFQVPRSLLFLASSWFKKALDERFKEGKDHVLRLPGTNIETVKNFLFWLYKKRSPFSRALAKKDDVDAIEAQHMAAIHLWAFGDKHFIPEVQDLAFASLDRSMDDDGVWPSIAVIKLGYTVSTAGSPLRRLLSQVSIKGLRAHQASPSKKVRRRHQRHSSTTSTISKPSSEGYTVTEFEQIDDTPGLLIDILKGFIGHWSTEPANMQGDALNENQKRSASSSSW